MTALRFREALGPQPGGAVRLVYGYTAPPPVIPPTAGLRAWVAAAWGKAVPVQARVAAPWQQAGRIAPLVLTTGWSRTYPTGAWVAAPWQGTTPLRPAALAAPWRQAGTVRAGWDAPWQQTNRVRAEVVSPWRQGAPARAVLASGWRQGALAQRVVAMPWRAGRPAAVFASSIFGRALPAVVWLAAPWRDGMRVTSFGGAWTPPTVPVVGFTPCYVPAPGGAVALRFARQMDGLTRLIFTCNHAGFTVRVPVQRVYMITNVTTLLRVEGGVAIPCFGLTLSLDVDSWAWGFSASLPADSLALIEPNVAGEPVELEATVNGTAFRLVAESLSRERSFGQAAVRVQGRGKTAVLDAPYSPPISFGNPGGALTSQQLVDQALPAGWTAAWGLTAWSVPAGVWSHLGTPMTAALTVAAAGGGYVQPHATLNQIRVLPRYPTAPWDWAAVTPDFELPSAVVTRESIDWVEKPRYNRVYVSGTTAGVLGRVTRTGTAGDVVALVVTDPLITHADAARQRGLRVLADGGRQANVRLRLPVLEVTGIILPGNFVRYVDGAVTRRGIVRSVSVETGRAETWQTLGVETHVND